LSAHAPAKGAFLFINKALLMAPTNIIGDTLSLEI
jgi:hypothetical protein